LTTEEEILEYC